MVNTPGDVYEQEADRVADQVLAAPAHPAVSGAPPRIQRFSGQSNGQMDAAPASVDQALASPGRPLEPALRQDMEQRFGHDFSRVRVHSGAAAEQSARDVNAHAYTVGHNIVFGAGRFAPGTHEGRRLIAHELTHVVQQSGADGIRVGQSNEKRGLSPIDPHISKSAKEDLKPGVVALPAAAENLAAAWLLLRQPTEAKKPEPAVKTSVRAGGPRLDVAPGILGSGRFRNSRVWARTSGAISSDTTPRMRPSARGSQWPSRKPPLARSG